MKIGLEIKKIRIRSVAVSGSISGLFSGQPAHCGTAARKTKQRPLTSVTLMLTLMLMQGACQPQPSQAPPSAMRSTQAQVTLGYINRSGSQAQDQAQDQAASWTLSEGTLVELERFLWVISDVELHACEPAAQHSQSWPSLITTAYAHVPTSSTRHGAPYVEDLLAPPDRARIVGELGPPKGQYCAIYTVIAPADDDVINATATPTEELIGKSYWIKGRLKRAQDPAWINFDLSGPLKLITRIDSINPKDPSAPLTLSDEDSAAFILLDKTLDAAAFEPLIQGAKPDTASAQAIVTRLAKRQRVYRKTSP